MGPDGKRIRPGISSSIISELTDCNAVLSQQRKKRQVNSGICSIGSLVTLGGHKCNIVDNFSSNVL